MHTMHTKPSKPPSGSRITIAIVALVWIAGLVAGLLMRSHGLIPALVVAAVNAGIAGAVYRLRGSR